MRSMLVAFAGFGGAGKTTAIKYLEQERLGRHVYLGAAVIEEITRRGLAQTAGAEREVRIDLRSKGGPSVFADRKASEISELVRNGERVLVDAIFKIEEYERLQSCGQSKSALVAIDSSFDTRLRRLEVRPERVYTAEELRKRDDLERGDLGMARVLNAADLTIVNEGSLTDFLTRMRAALTQLSESQGSG